MLYSFNDTKAPTTKQVQYFKMLGNRGVWHKGWKAVTFHGRQPWESEAKWSFDKDKWELYNVEQDFSEYNNLAHKQPDKLRHLVEMWWAEAGKYNVLPLDDRISLRLLARETKEQPSCTYYADAVRIPQGSAPHTKDPSHRITAEVESPTNGAEDPICVMGGASSGWSLYIKDQKLVYCYIYAIYETFDIGLDSGTPVTNEYKHGARFNGKIEKVVIDLLGERHIDPEAEARIAMKRQ